MTGKKKVKALVLRAAGTNCDRETCHAFRIAGAGQVDLVHINSLIKNEVRLKDYHILAFPGGFSYGDDVAAGRIFATQLKSKLFRDISEFDKEGRLVIGICNGFQVLVKLGLLPGVLTLPRYTKLRGRKKPKMPKQAAYRQTATLGWNDSGRFECRWVYLKAVGSRYSWTDGLESIVQLPVAHAEGKFIAEDKKLLDDLEKNGQLVFRYADESGNMQAGYPFNPNGSARNIAGITNRKGNIFGLMPHPERFVIAQQHPWWGRNTRIEVPAGLKIFRNAVNTALSELQ